MSGVTRIFAQIEFGDSSVAEQLLRLAYDELRKLVALVHDAYTQLADGNQTQHWDSEQLAAERKIFFKRCTLSGSSQVSLYGIYEHVLWNRLS